MTAVPGWYADPSGPGTVRYWDGAAWTQHVQPVPVAPVPTYPPQSYPYYAPAVPVKNSKATSALVWSLVSLVINPFALPSILAIVFGVQGRRMAEQLEGAGQPNAGRGRATSGLVIGIVGAALFVVWMFLYFTRN
ncbi:DUF2510 domain-containing protein [Leifsonia poae]|uniref:DUF2510 domain-containing protein n=1 Tax=Leifsonia poae TaxID=110933 RepID=UPI003D69519D